MMRSNFGLTCPIRSITMRTLNQTEILSIAGGCNECQSIDNGAVLSTVLKYAGIGACTGFGLSLAVSVTARDFQSVFPMLALVFTGVGAQFGAMGSLYPLLSDRDSYVKQQ